MKKALGSIAVVAMVLAGCSGGGGMGFRHRAAEMPPAKQQKTTEGKTVVALLLPLSGQYASLGQAVQDAAQLALYDTNNNNIELHTLDTGADNATAATAIQKAVAAHAKLIVGPVFSVTTQAIAPVARRNDIHVISLSNDKNVAGNGVYVLGFLPDQQIGRVTGFAADHGVETFAAIVPNDAYGMMAVNSYKAAIRQHGKKEGQIEYYVNNPQMEESLGRIVGSINGALEGSASPQALLIPDGGGALAKIAPMVNGDSQKHVQILGSGQWDNPQVFTNPALNGGWFAGANPEQRARFEQRFQASFGYTPPRIASLAYDAVAMASVLPRDKDGFSRDALTNPKGFIGVDGIFRLRKDGLSERGLAVLQIDSGSVRVIDPAPGSF